MADLTDYAGKWTLDPARTTIKLRTKAAWIVPVNATAKAIDGHGTVTPDGQLSGVLVIDAASLDTGNRKRDEHLRHADFFDAANHPAMTFTAHDARLPGPRTAEINGTFTVRTSNRGHSRPRGIQEELRRLHTGLRRCTRCPK